MAISKLNVQMKKLKGFDKDTTKNTLTLMSYSAAGVLNAATIT